MYSKVLTCYKGDPICLPSSRSFRHKLDERGEPFAVASYLHFSQLKSKDSESHFGPELLNHVVKCTPRAFLAGLSRYKARSPFSALGGVGDKFHSPADLCKNCRR